MTTYELLLLLATIVSAAAGAAFVWAMVGTYKGQILHDLLHHPRRERLV